MTQTTGATAARVYLDTRGLATDWPPPRRTPPRWVRWVLPLAVLALVAGVVYGLGGFRDRRYRPNVLQPGDMVTMDGVDITPLEAFVMPRTNKLLPTTEVRVFGVCENRRDDTVQTFGLANAGILVIDPMNVNDSPTPELWLGTWRGVGTLSWPPGQGKVPCHIKANMPAGFTPTGTILLQLGNPSYADRTVLQIGNKTWGGVTEQNIFYLPLSIA